MHELWLLYLCAAGGWLVSAVCAAVWCDAGVMGYADEWRSRTAKRVYSAGITAALAALAVLAWLLLRKGLCG